MTLHITLFNDESEDFSIGLRMDADASFGDLHRLILKACNYKEVPGQRFFICDENWRPGTRILLSDEAGVDIDEDVLLMDHTDLGEFLEDEGQHLTYRFDPEHRRMLLLTLRETSFGDPVSEQGEVESTHGTAPTQFVLEEDEEATAAQAEVSEELGEEFYGEDGFTDDEFDEEAFDIMEE